jgi:predicted acetyltransferase
MSYKTIFDKDEHTTTTYEEADGKITLEKHQDAEPIIDRNKKEFNSGINNSSTGAVGRKVASIPLTVWQNWMKETKGEIQRDPVLLAKYLNDPDNQYFRTHNSRI